MDENKDFLNEGTVSETDTNEDNGVVDIAEMAKPNVQAPQKKPLVMKPVLVAAGIVLVVALAVIVIRLFFNSSVEGTWHYVREVPMMAADATSDEPETVSVDYYFKFERDNKVSATIGTITSRGTYDVYKNSEGQSVINMNLTDLITSYNFLAYGEYEISVSGNAFTGRKLVMSTAQDESGTIEMESASYAAPEIERENEFTVNEDIVGKWEFKQEGYDLSYEFGKDGTTKYNEYVKQTNPYTGMETTEIYTKDSSMDIVYTLDDNTLTINGFPFVREGTATADSAE